MSITDAIFAILAMETPKKTGELGIIHGRTLLQKKMYFLSVLSEKDFGFRPHYYGPYSPQVSNSLSAMIEAGFIEEYRVGYGKPATFGEITRYDYKLTAGGDKVVKSLPEIVDPYREKLSKINRSKMASDINTISIAAKVHFILSEDQKATIEEIREEADSMGWNISEQAIDRVVEYLEHLGLVRIPITE